MFGNLLQGTAKYVAFISLRVTIAEQYAYLEGVHEKLQDPFSNRYAILSKWSKIFNVVSKFVVSVILTAVVSLMMFPSLLYLLTGNVETMLPIMIFGIDESTRSGYIALQGVHGFWLACGGFGFIGSDMTFIMMSLYAWPLSYLFIDHMDELNKVLRASPKMANTKNMEMFLQNIVQLHQELCV